MNENSILKKVREDIEKLLPVLGNGLSYDDFTDEVIIIFSKMLKKKIMQSCPSPPRPDLDVLIKKSIQAFEALPPEEKKKHLKEQRISWVYGNLSLDNPHITREMVEKASKDW